MANILHLTFDLRDRLNRSKTTAVKNLIEIITGQHDCFTIDLLRVPNFREEKSEYINENHLLINSFGLPFGIFMLKSLNRVYLKILNEHQKKNIDLNSFDIIHAHKLTFEGYIGHLIAIKFNKPLIFTFRQTDSMVLRRRPALLKVYKDVVKTAGYYFYPVPYMNKIISERFGINFYSDSIKGKEIFLPNIVERNFGIASIRVEDNILLTILRMDKRSVWRKNLKRLLGAFRLINNPEIKLKIIGDGEYRSKVEKWVNDMNLNNRVIFTGSVPNSEIDRHYASALAFVLPSISETFGMVYAESLINGTPILYSENVPGFDGIFKNVGTGVNPWSVESIKNGIEELINNNKIYRDNIRQLKSENAFRIFGSDFIIEQYNKVINSLLTNKENG